VQEGSRVQARSESRYGKPLDKEKGDKGAQTPLSDFKAKAGLYLIPDRGKRDASLRENSNDLLALLLFYVVLGWAAYCKWAALFRVYLWRTKIICIVFFLRNVRVSVSTTCVESIRGSRSTPPPGTMQTDNQHIYAQP
jgi:hypothetical protein